MSQDFATLALRVQQAGAEQTEKSLRAVSREANKLAREFKNTEQATKGYSKETKVAAKTTDKVTNANEKLDRGLTRSSGRLKVIGRDINRYLVLPLTAIIGLSSRAALTLNEGLGAVQTLIPTAGDRIYELRDGIRDLAQESGRSMKELNDGLYQTISVFQDNADTMDRVTTATKMAIAGYASTTDAVNLLSAVTRAYGDTSAIAVDKVADLAFETVRLGATTIPQLAGAMQVATDRAVRLNVSQEELFTVMATLTGITGDASMVATQFRSAMDSLLSPTDAMVELLDDMGYQSAEAAIEQLGLVTVLKAVYDASEASGRSLRSYITRKEGETLVSRLATQQLGDYTDKLEELTDYHGAAARSFDVVRTGVAKYNFDLNVAKERASALAAEVGENMLPSLVFLATALGDVIEAFSLLPDWLQRSLVGFTALSLGVSVMYQLRGVIQSFIQYNVFSGFLSGLQAIGIAGKTTAAALTGLLGIIGGVALAIGALAVVFVSFNRRVAESAEEAESRMRRLKSSVEDVSSAIPTVDTAAQRMRIGGNLPGIQVGDDYKTPAYEDLAGMDESERQALLAAYESRLAQLNQSITNSLQLSVDMVKRDASDAYSELTRYLNEQWYKEMFSFAPRAVIQEITKIVESEEIGAKIMEFVELARTEMKRLEADWGGVDDAGVLGGHVIADVDLSTARRNYEELSEMVERFVVASRSAADTQGFNEAMRSSGIEANQLRAAIALVTEEMEDPPDVKTWQKHFAEVTDIAAAEYVQFGEQAAALYVSAFEEELDWERSFSEFLPFSLDEEQILRDRLSAIADHMRELFSIEDGDIDDPFEFYNASIEGMGDHFRDVLERIATLVSTDLAEGFKEADADMERRNQMIDDFGLNLDHATLSQDDFMDRAQKVTEALADLVSLGLDPSSEAAQVFTDYINNLIPPGAITEIDKLIASLEEEIHTFHMSEREMFKYSLTLMDDVSPAQRQAAIDQYDMNVALHEARAEAELLDEAMKTLITSFIDSGVRMFADTLFDIGQALGEDALNANNAADMFAQLGLQLLRLIPMLMITAGLQLLIGSMGYNPLGWALLAMGLAGTIGAGVATGAYNKKKEDAQQNAKGNVFSEGNVVPFASGGAFTNSIVNKPTLFPMAKGAGLMGEAGPEAIMPLARTSTGELGVRAESTGSPVVVNVINKTDNSQASVSESTGDNGMREIKVMIENVVRKGTASGAFDKVNRSRYGITPQGVRV